MTESSAALFGAGIGAVAGIVGGALAALSALRASQIAARVPLTASLYEITTLIVSFSLQQGREEEHRALVELEKKWIEFSIQQRILCPSWRIEAMSALLRRFLSESQLPAGAFIQLSAQTLERITQMIAAHSSHLLRRSAYRKERKIIRAWLGSKEAQLLSEEIRRRISKLANRTQRAWRRGV